LKSRIGKTEAFGIAGGLLLYKGLQFAGANLADGVSTPPGFAYLFYLKVGHSFNLILIVF